MIASIKRWTRRRSPVITPFLCGAGCAVGRELIWLNFPASNAAIIWVFLVVPLMLVVLNYPFLSYRRTLLVTTFTVAGMQFATPFLWRLRWGTLAPIEWAAFIVGGIGLWLVLLGLTAAAVAIRRRLLRRRGLGRCRVCGYSRFGLSGVDCPECGTAVLPTGPQPEREDADLPDANT